MQIDGERPRCPVCRAADVERVPLMHHMICAYVGPEYDFGERDDGYMCPKCRRAIVAHEPACEIVGESARCRRCGSEMVVAPAGR